MSALSLETRMRKSLCCCTKHPFAFTRLALYFMQFVDGKGWVDFQEPNCKTWQLIFMVFVTLSRSNFVWTISRLHKWCKTCLRVRPAASLCNQSGFFLRVSLIWLALEFAKVMRKRGVRVGSDDYNYAMMESEEPDPLASFKFHPGFPSFSNVLGGLHLDGYSKTNSYVLSFPQSF